MVLRRRCAHRPRVTASAASATTAQRARALPRRTCALGARSVRPRASPCRLARGLVPLATSASHRRYARTLHATAPAPLSATIVQQVQTRPHRMRAQRDLLARRRASSRRRARGSAPGATTAQLQAPTRRRSSVRSATTAPQGRGRRHPARARGAAWRAYRCGHRAARSLRAPPPSPTPSP